MLVDSNSNIEHRSLSFATRLDIVRDLQVAHVGRPCTHASLNHGQSQRCAWEFCFSHPEIGQRGVGEVEGPSHIFVCIICIYIYNLIHQQLQNHPFSLDCPLHLSTIQLLGYSHFRNPPYYITLKKKQQQLQFLHPKIHGKLRTRTIQEGA